MPTSSIVDQVSGRRQLSLSYQTQGGRASEVLISPLTQASDYAGVAMASFTSTAYGVSNRAIGFMFCLAEPFLVQKVWWMNGTTATTNNADVGVYTEDGATLLVSGGSTLIATANVIQEINCTDTLLIAPGRYWAVYNQNGTTATPICVTYAAPALARMAGIAAFAGAVSLGATFTPAATAELFIPYFGIAGRVKAA